MNKCNGKPACEPDAQGRERICNPDSGQCVLRTGKIGLALLGGGLSKKAINKATLWAAKNPEAVAYWRAECAAQGKAYNPYTRKCIAQDGAVARQIAAGTYIFSANQAAAKKVNAAKVNAAKVNVYETWEQWDKRTRYCGNKKCPEDKDGNPKRCNPKTMKCVSKFSKVAKNMLDQHLQNQKRLYKPGYPL